MPKDAYGYTVAFFAVYGFFSSINDLHQGLKAYSFFRCSKKEQKLKEKEMELKLKEQELKIKQEKERMNKLQNQPKN